ncbi:MAG: hypothetical protein LAT64_10875 [Phycisphaerales bacterium]|nr:hypothetical protein [Planctomycetota bacterium]MCH8509253.1 hypothetical protein [Phycisphaerales bacterium]
MTPRTLIEGLLGLTALGFSTRFRVGGAYWRWRMHTAFPGGRPAEGGRMALVRLALEYGAWAWRTRRLR